MDRSAARTWISSLASAHDEMSAVFDAADTLTGLSVDSPFGAACWKAFDLLLKVTAELLGDANESLSWYILDNDCGRNALQHSLPDVTMRCVTTIDDLLDCMGF